MSTHLYFHSYLLKAQWDWFQGIKEFYRLDLTWYISHAVNAFFFFPSHLQLTYPWNDLLALRASSWIMSFASSVGWTTSSGIMWTWLERRGWRTAAQLGAWTGRLPLSGVARTTSQSQDCTRSWSTCMGKRASGQCVPSSKGWTQ